MSDIIIFAASHEEHMRAGRFYERLGWVLGALAFVVLFAGVIYSELLRRKQKDKDQKDEDE